MPCCPVLVVVQAAQAAPPKLPSAAMCSLVVVSLLRVTDLAHCRALFSSGPGMSTTAQTTPTPPRLRDNNWEVRNTEQMQDTTGQGVNAGPSTGQPKMRKGTGVGVQWRIFAERVRIHFVG
jgi:hypothetical protein